MSQTFVYFVDGESPASVRCRRGIGTLSSGRHYAARAVLLIVMFLTSVLSGSGSALAAEVQPATPAQSSAHAAEAIVTVVTETGKRSMSQQEYASFTREMGHLPEMPASYVFGKKIARPQTDQFGHIRVSDGSTLVPGNSEQDRSLLPAPPPQKPKHPATVSRNSAKIAKVAKNPHPAGKTGNDPAKANLQTPRPEHGPSN